jgi:hypothetical protein
MPQLIWEISPCCLNNLEHISTPAYMMTAVAVCGFGGKSKHLECVKLLAKMSGGDLSSTILRIYQTLAVEFQTARAEQIYITNRRYVTTTPPVPPSSLFHPIPPIVHPPLPLPLLDPRET